MFALFTQGPQRGSLARDFLSPCRRRPMRKRALGSGTFHTGAIQPEKLEKAEKRLPSRRAAQKSLAFARANVPSFYCTALRAPDISNFAWRIPSKRSCKKQPHGSETVLGHRSFGLGVRNGLMYNVFAAHARERVEVFGFAIRPHDDGADEDERKKVEANIEHFIDISQVEFLNLPRPSIASPRHPLPLFFSHAILLPIIAPSQQLEDTGFSYQIKELRNSVHGAWLFLACSYPCVKAPRTWPR